MEIKCRVNCNGIGYENFKAGEIREISKETAEKLIDFGYAEKTSTEKDSSKQVAPPKAPNKKKREGAAAKTDDTGKSASEGEAAEEEVTGEKVNPGEMPDVDDALRDDGEKATE